MNSLHTKIPKKIDLRPKKHHGFYIFIWIMGMLLPPLGECVHDGHGACAFVMGRMGDSGQWLGHPEAYRPGGRRTGASSLGARPLDPVGLCVRGRRHCRTCGRCPLTAAIAVRFGIGIDFFINVILTICGCKSHPAFLPKPLRPFRWTAADR